MTSCHVYLVATTILGLIPLLRLLNAKIVLELSMQILPHAPLVALVNIMTARLKLAKSASEPSVQTKRRALHVLIIFLLIMALRASIMETVNTQNTLTRQKKNACNAKETVVQTS